MSRVAVAGCMALAALSAVAVLDVGSPTAEAAPSVSSFAGSYVGSDPLGHYGSWAVTISDGGQITASSSIGSISGRVGADGAYSFTVTTYWPDLFDRRGGPKRVKSSYKSAGNMVSDAAGNIVGTADTGESFVWLRQ